MLKHMRGTTCEPQPLPVAHFFFPELLQGLAPLLQRVTELCVGIPCSQGACGPFSLCHKVLPRLHPFEPSTASGAPARHPTTPRWRWPLFLPCPAVRTGGNNSPHCPLNLWRAEEAFSHVWGVGPCPQGPSTVDLPKESFVQAEPWLASLLCGLS